MLHLLAYHQSMGTWVAHTVARGLIYRVIWRVTDHMQLGLLLILAAAALFLVWFVRRYG